MVASKVDGYNFFDAFIQYWEGNPVEYSLYAKSDGASPLISTIVVYFI